MKASKAREIAYLAVKDAGDVLSLIEEVAKHGGTGIYVDGLSVQSISDLEDLGYDVRHIISFTYKVIW